MSEIGGLLSASLCNPSNLQPDQYNEVTRTNFGGTDANASSNSEQEGVLTVRN